MKFKTLFLSMLGAAAIVSCNNEVIGPDGAGGPNGAYEGGETTHATFSFKLTDPGTTFAGSGSIAGTGRESEISNVGMFIYDATSGDPEAMAYMTNTDFAATGNDKRVTVRCKAGTKLIYVAANFGTNANRLMNIRSSVDTTNTLSPAYMGVDWTATASLGPGFSTVKNGAILNAPIWAATGSTISLDTVVGGPTNTTGALNLIKALTGNGIVGNGITSGNTGTDVFYLMSNWGDNNNNPADNNGIDDYPASAKHILEQRVSATDSRDPNLNKNHIKIFIQRAVAKLAVRTIDNSVLSPAGTGSNAGAFVPEAKWAAGNINSSEYPFQMWDAATVKSTRYDESTPILPATGNKYWAKKMDNTRIEPSGQSYENQNLSASAVINKMKESGTLNVGFAPLSGDPAAADYIILTENNNKETYSHYTTYVLLAGQYRPTRFILSVSSVGVPEYNDASGIPTNLATFASLAWNAGTPTPVNNTRSGETVVDTMFYVASYGTDGLFFLGQQALLQYIAYSPDVLDGKESDGSPITTPAASQRVVDVMNDLLKVSGDKQADLQKYWRGNCFYRVWVQDNSASGANKVLVRRNHAYHIKVTKINGPGIGNPNDIIDPDPETIEPIEAVNTYVTAEIEIMKWHVIDQETPIGL